MKSAKQLVSEANQQIETLTPDEAIKLAADENVVFVDLREPAEVEKDSLCGARATWAPGISGRSSKPIA